jgi:hypothetical protein
VEFLRVALLELTWGRLLTAQTIGFIANLLRYLESVGSTRPAHQLLLNTIFTTIAPFLIVVASLCATEAVRRGTAALRAHALALLAASGFSAIIQVITRHMLYLQTPGGAASTQLANAWLGFAVDMGDVLLAGGIAMLAYYNRHRAEGILEGIRAVELRRVRLERQLTESRLAAARAEIDPGTLFESLAHIRTLYDTSAPDADRELESLIQTLRTRSMAISAARAAVGASP